MAAARRHPPTASSSTSSRPRRRGAAPRGEEDQHFMAIAVVSPSGDLVYFREDGQHAFASVNIAIHKARAAAVSRPTSSSRAVGAGRLAHAG